ncbi:MAG: FecR domain-containing protein [Beijerinckiaceae bacterium]|nr:FecR domain-containing protein [Beijerinckiaceae bacterium]
MVHFRSPNVAAAGLLLALQLVLPDATHAQQVGTAAAANTVSTGTPPGGKNRVIELGTQVVRREKIDTSASGTVQLLFVDKTTFNIGPNSSIIIDDFVFNPDTDTGKMAATLTKGVLRVVGGQASHTGGTTIRTPSATIGIRGGVATISHCAGAACATQGTRVINHFGTLTVASQAGVETIRRPGFAVTVASAPGAGGQASASAGPTAPVRVQQSEVDNSNVALTSKPGQVGGATAIPTDQVAVNAGVGTVNTSVSPTYRSAQTQTQSDGQARTGDVAANTTNSNQTTSVVAQATKQQVDTVAPTTVPPVTPPVVLPKPAAFALITTVDPALGSRAPYLLGTFAASGTYQVSRVLGYRVGGANADGTPNTTARTLQASLSINGSGASQTSTFAVATGVITNDDVFGYISTGGFNASSRTSSVASQTRAQGAISSTGAVPVDANGIPTTFTTDQNTLSSDNPNNFHQRTATTAFTNTGAGSNYGFQQNVTQTTTPSGLGADRPDDNLTGYVGGLARTARSTPSTASTATSLAPSFQVVNATDSPGDISITLLNNSSRVSAVFNIRNASPSTADSLNTAELRFGSAAGFNGSRGAYIDSKNFGARSETVFSAGNNTETSKINGKDFLPNTANFTQRTGAFFVTSDTVNAASFFPAVTFCNCDFTRWGFWSIDVARLNDPAGASADFDRGNLLTWVAGRAARAADVPTTGVATYTGHAIASIRNGASEYVAASNFTNTVNFGTRVGAVSIPNLDSTAYSGNVTINPSNVTQFGGTIASTNVAGRSAVLNGSFFQGSASPIGEMGGTIRLGGGPGAYLGAGTFAARR